MIKPKTISVGCLIGSPGAVPTGTKIKSCHPLTDLSAGGRVVWHSGGTGSGPANPGLEGRRSFRLSTILVGLCLLLQSPLLRAGEMPPKGQSTPVAVVASAPDIPHQAVSEPGYPVRTSCHSGGDTSGSPGNSLGCPPTTSFALANAPAVNRGSAQKLEDALARHGIDVDVFIVTDVTLNMRGGISAGASAVRHLTHLRTIVDTEKLLGWHGGTIYLDVQEHHGRLGSAFVGDAQAFSNLDAQPGTHIGEFWFQQEFYDGRVRLKGGRIDANTDFAFVENGGEFLNSSMGHSPTITLMSTYPDPQPGFSAFVTPTQRFYAGAGMYRSALGGNVQMGEVGSRWDLGTGHLPGRIGLGFWNFSGHMDRFDGITKPGTAGFFLVADQKLWRRHPQRPDDDQGIGVFLQLGTASQEVCEITLHTGGGMEWKGALPGRSADVLGLGITRVEFTRQQEAGFDLPSELAVESFYKIQLKPWLGIAPDVQYIRHPGGVSGRPDAIAGSIRVTIDVLKWLKPWLRTRPGS